MNINDISENHFRQLAKVAGYSYLTKIWRHSACFINPKNGEKELIKKSICLVDYSKEEYSESPYFKQLFILDLDKFEFSFADYRKNENKINQAIRNQNLVFKKLIDLGYDL